MFFFLNFFSNLIHNKFSVLKDYNKNSFRIQFLSTFVSLIFMLLIKKISKKNFWCLNYFRPIFFD